MLHWLAPAVLSGTQYVAVGARASLPDQRLHGKCRAADSSSLLLQAYLESASQPGFDGPFIVELTILRTLNKVHSQLTTPAYRHYFHDLRPADLERAKQLTDDPYMLIKFKVGKTCSEF